MHNLNELEQDYNKILILFDRVSILFWFIPIPTILLNWNRMSKELKIFAFYLVALLSLHFIENIHIWAVLKFDPYWEFMKSIDIRDTNFFNIFYRLTSYIFLGFFYEITILKENNHELNFKKKSLILCMIAIFIFFFIDGYSKFGTVNSILSKCFQIILPLISINQMFKYRLNSNIWKNSFFLVNLGILLPTAFTLILSFFSDSLHENHFILFVQSIIARNIISLIGEILFAFAFVYSNNSKFR